MKRARPLFLILALLALLPPQLHAAEALRIAVHEKPPYAQRDEQGAWVGLGISLWQSISERTGIAVAFVEVPFEEIIPAVASGRVDGAVGELAVTPENEEMVRFTQPFIISSIGVAILPQKRVFFDWRNLISDLKSPDLVHIAIAIVLGMFLISLVIWLLERRHRVGHFHGGLPGFGSALWFSAVTMTGVGYGDKIPSTFIGRLVSFFWMLAGVLLVAGLTAAVTSSITASRLNSLLTDPGALHRLTCATLTGSASQAILKREGIGNVGYESLAAAVSALEQGTVQAVVGDTLSLRYLAHRRLHESSPVRFTVANTTLKDAFIGIPLPRHSPHYDAINMALLEVIASPEWAETVRRWLGRDRSES